MGAPQAAPTKTDPEPRVHPGVPLDPAQLSTLHSPALPSSPALTFPLSVSGCVRWESVPLWARSPSERGLGRSVRSEVLQSTREGVGAGSGQAEGRAALRRAGGSALCAEQTAAPGRSWS